MKEKTLFASNVAPRRRMRPQARERWTCRCGAEHAPYVAKCGCGGRRP